jgi:hypothetical protein
VTRIGRGPAHRAHRTGSPGGCGAGNRRHAANPATSHRAALPAHRLHQAASSSGGSGRQCGLIVMGHSSSRGGGASREERCASHASRSSRATASLNGEHHPCYDGSRVVLPREEATPSCGPSQALGAQTPGCSSSRCVGAYPHRSRSSSSRLLRLPQGSHIQQVGAVFQSCGEGRPHGQRRDRPLHVALEISARHTRRRTSRSTTPRPSSEARRPIACSRRYCVPPPGVSSGRPGGRCAGPQGRQGRCRRARSSQT